jgi:hypothetical protein
MPGTPMSAPPLSAPPVPHGLMPPGGMPAPPPAPAPMAAPPMPPAGFPTSAIPMPQSAVPMYATPGPPRRSRTLMLVLSGLVALLVIVGIVTAVALSGGGKPTTDPTTPPVTISTSTDPSADLIEMQRHVHLSTPQKIGDLVLSTDAAKVQGANDTRDSLRPELLAPSPELVGAFYDGPTDGGTIRSVLVVAATGDFDDPDKQITKILYDPTISLTNIRTVEAGEIGASAKCADATTNGRVATVCIWADYGSVGVVFFGGYAKSDSEELFRQVRAAMIIPG